MKVDSELLKLFLESMHDGLIEIHVLLCGTIDQNTLQAVARIAHKLKGEAAVIGFKKLTQTVAELEDIVEYHQNAGSAESISHEDFTEQLNLISGLCQQITKTYSNPVEKESKAGESSRNSEFASVLKLLTENVSQGYNKPVEICFDNFSPEHIPPELSLKIQDIVIQLVRNAIAHGIEMPEVRTQRNKGESGRIEVSVEKQGRQLLIEVKDDGQGIDLEKIRVRLINRYKLSVAKTAKLPAKKLLASLFLPGFSTSSDKDEHAGRGVGLDLVKDHVHNMKGMINIDSRLGKFTKFAIRIPVDSVPSSSVVSMEEAKKRLLKKAEKNIFSKIG